MKQKPNTCRVCGHDEKVIHILDGKKGDWLICKRCGACACDECFNSEITPQRFAEMMEDAGLIEKRRGD